MRATTLGTCTKLLLVLTAITLLAGNAAATLTIDPDFTTPPPSGGQYVLSGCRNDGTIVLPNGSGQFICPDAAYTTGNLGKGWNELDLVPFRLSTSTPKGAITTYDFGLAGEYQTNGITGWDVLGSDAGAGPTLNVAESDASCSATWTAQRNDGPGLSGSDNTIFRTLTITQNPNTTCVFDYYMRLALGSHLYPGSSLHGMEFQTSDFNTGTKNIPLPVKEILPQSLSKTMAATQNMTIPWSVTKTANPATLTLADTCNPSSPLSQPVAITITWKKLAAVPTGGVMIETIVSATNPSARVITATIFDKIYGGSDQSNLLNTSPTVTVDLPANSTTTVLTHDFTDNSGLYTSYNDIATASYTDKVTGVPIPGTVTAAASANVQAGTTENATATIHDDESITGNTLEFSVDSTVPAQPYGTFSCTLGSPTTACGWDSPTLSASGSVVFNKSVSVAPKTITSGDLTDTAVLTGSQGFTTTSNKLDVTISANAFVTLDITKDVTGLTSGSQTFQFHAKGTTGSNAGVDVGDPTLTFTAGQTQLSTSPITGLIPDTYEVTEDSVTGWINDSPQDVALTLPTCSGTATLHNTQEGTIIVKKVTSPAGGTGFTYTGDAAGTIDDGGNITVNNLAPGTYTSTESAKTGWDLTNLSCTTDGSGSGSTATFNLHAGETITCTFTNTQRGTIIVKKVTSPAGGTGFSYTGDAAGTIDDGGNITVNNLVPGTYTSTESAKTGWDLTNLSCTTDGSGSGSTATFNLHAGETITCTFTNTQRGTIIVKKVTNPAGGTGFSYTGDAAGTIDDGGNITVNNLVPGTYTSTESAKTGWDLTNLSCTTDGSGSGSTATFNLHAGETITCTFTNTQRGTIVVKKVTSPAGGTGFTYTGDAAGTINDGGNITVNNLVPGTYTSTESAKTGWDLTNLSCTTDGSGSGSTATFNLHAGETITCTFTNTQRGTIVVKKVTNPAGGTGFTYTGDAAGTINDGQNITVNNLVPGTYTSTESAKTGWDLTNLSCTTDGSGSGSTATFNLHAGETITCTFTNTQRGTIVVKKVTSPAGGTGFTYTGDAAGTIDDGGNITVNNLVPGTYHSTESAKTGWDLTNLSCTTDGSGSGSIATFNLHAGETITCTFTNTQRGSLVIKKVTQGADGTFNYTGGGTGVPGSFSITTSGDAGSYPPITNLVPGSGYSVSEKTPNNGNTGFAQVGTATCDHGTPGAIQILPGTTTTCTFTNATAFTKVIKTFNGSSNLGTNSFTFQLRIGASPTAAGTILETLTATGTNNTLNFTSQLIPGTTYEMCEQMQPGWMTTLGPPLYSVFNPSGDNSVVCTNFTPAAGGTSTTTFTINNQPPPGGMALTIGFWKNWSSCTGGGQKPTLDQTLYLAQTKTPPGISIGTLNLYPVSNPNNAGTICIEAVDILNKLTITGKKEASNPFFNMAAQLLGAELNIVAGAGANACVVSDINSAQNLLVAVGFNGSKVPTGTSLQQNDANYFQTQLNNYNNNKAFTCTITYP